MKKIVLGITLVILLLVTLVFVDYTKYYNNHKDDNDKFSYYISVYKCDNGKYNSRYIRKCKGIQDELKIGVYNSDAKIEEVIYFDDKAYVLFKDYNYYLYDIANNKRVEIKDTHDKKYRLVYQSYHIMGITFYDSYIEYDKEESPYKKDCMYYNLRTMSFMYDGVCVITYINEDYLEGTISDNSNRIMAYVIDVNSGNKIVGEDVSECIGDVVSGLHFAIEGSFIEYFNYGYYTTPTDTTIYTLDGKKFGTYDVHWSGSPMGDAYSMYSIKSDVLYTYENQAINKYDKQGELIFSKKVGNTLVQTLEDNYYIGIKNSKFVLINIDTDEEIEICLYKKNLYFNSIYIIDGEASVTIRENDENPSFREYTINTLNKTVELTKTF